MQGNLYHLLQGFSTLGLILSSTQTKSGRHL